MRPITNQRAFAGIWIFILLLSGLCFRDPGFCEDPGKSLDFLLPAPENPVHRQYLGLSTETPFSLGQIRGRVVIIEIFSMYCPVCQREAGNINVLYQLIQSRPALKDKVKLIGIGAGNSAFEVDFFRTNYHIEFPLFSDADFSIHKKIGEVRTPFFFGLSLKEGGGFSVFLQPTGGPV